MIFEGLPPARMMRGQDGLVELEFESDIDHAIYFAGKPVAGTGKERSSDQKEALTWLQSLGLSYGDILDSRKKLIASIRDLKTPPGSGDLFVPATDTARQFEEQEIPVDVEVVEVERKEPNEPIVIQIEAPLEDPELTAPKRIRIPRRKNTFKKKNKTDKRTTAEAMARGFNKNLLDPLIESIVNPPAPIPSKKRKKKQVQAQKKTKVAVQKIPKGPNYDKTGADDPYKARNFNEFVGKKIGSAFKSAALARKEFIDMGGSVDELKGRKLKDSFIAKSLGFEFGGDKLARTKGMFSKTPDAFQDPALTRGQRFRAGISPLMSSTLPRPTPSTPAEAGVAPEVNVEPIQLSYSNILDGFDFSAQNSDNSVKAEKEGADTIKQFNSLVEEIKDLIEEKNKNKRTKLQLQQDKLLAEADAAQTEKDLAKEAQLEGSKDTAGTRRTKFAGSQTPGEEEEEKGERGGGILGDLLGFGVEFLTEELIERGAKKLFKQGGKKALQEGGKQVAKIGTGSAAATAAIVGGAGLAASAIGEGFFQLTKKDGLGEKTRDFLKEKGEEIGGPLGNVVGAAGDLAGISNEATKVTGVALDAIGAPFRYAIEAIRYPFLNKEDREKQADNLAKFDSRIREYTRGWMNKIDVLNIVPDEKGGFGNIYGNDKANKEMMENMAGDQPTEVQITQQVAGNDFDPDNPTEIQQKVLDMSAQLGNPPPQKLSEGAAPLPDYNPPEFTPGQGGERQTISSPGTPAMVGEAGNELVGTEDELSSMAATVISEQTSDPIKESVRTILGVSSNIIGQTGLLGSAIRPFFEQEAAPLVKAFGLDNFTFTTDVGRGEGELKQASQKESKSEGSSGGLFNMLLNFLGMGEGKSTKGLPAAPGSGGPVGSLSTGGGGGKITANQAYSYLISKGLSDNHAKGIVANISRESGFKLGAHNPNDPGAGSFGLFQWNGVRAEAMMAAVPDYLTNWKGQIDYALGEDHGPRYLSTQFNSAGEAAYDWMKYWERPAAYVQAKYTPVVYDELINKMSLSESSVDTSDITPPSIPKQQNKPQTSSSGFQFMPQLQPQSPGVVPAAMPMAPSTPSAATPAGAYQSQGITPSTIMPLIQQQPVTVTPPASAPPQLMYGPPQPESSNSFQRRLHLAILEKQN